MLDVFIYKKKERGRCIGGVHYISLRILEKTFTTVLELSKTSKILSSVFLKYSKFKDFEYFENLNSS